MGTKNGGIQLTAEEQTEHEAAQAAGQSESAARAEAKVAQDAVDAQTAIDKASAKEKLTGAEYTPLTEAEADVILI